MRRGWSRPPGVRGVPSLWDLQGGRTPLPDSGESGGKNAQAPQPTGRAASVGESAAGLHDDDEGRGYRLHLLSDTEAVDLEDQPASLSLHQRKEAMQRLAEGAVQVDLARSYGASQSTISRLAAPGPFGASAAGA
jgi:hypothetical protein